MPLSKLTTDQIRDDAEAAVGADDMFHSFTSGYVKGATAWAIWKEKAEVYEKALRETLITNDPEVIREALEQFTNASS